MNENETQKIASLDTPYAKEQYLKFQKQHRQLIFKRRRLAALIAIAAFVAIVMGVQIFNEQRHLSELNEIKVKTRFYYSKDGELIFVLPDSANTSNKDKQTADEVVKSETAK